MTAQEWFIPGELAAIAKKRGIKGFPHHERGVRRHAEEAGWNSLPDNLCRVRSGREGGGGRAYHRSILPDTLQNAIDGEAVKLLQQAVQETRTAIERKKVEALPVTSLRFRQRQTMEARGEILLAIDHYGMQRGYVGLRRAILEFVQAQEAHADRAAALEKVEAGEALSHRERLALEQASPLQGQDGFGLLPDTLRLANDRSGGSFRVSRSTIYEWFSLRDAGGITALAPALTKEDEPISEEFNLFLTFYCKPSKLAASEALADLKEKHPGVKLTVEQVRYTLKHKLNDIERNVGREGLLTLRSRMAYIRRSTENLLPTTVYTADGKTFDAEIEHPVSKKAFKPEITSILDVATRKCVGFAISLKENVVAVTEALRKACQTHGVNAIFYVDRGPGYKNQTFDADAGGLMARLHITKAHALPYNSQAKGIIERFNGTVWNPLARKLPTYLGAEMDKEAAKIAHKTTRSEIKQFGSSTLLPLWEDFHAMCVKAIADYNARPHDGLPRYRDPATGTYHHYSPDQFWALHVADGFEPVSISSDDIDDLFRPYEVRKVRRSLVEWNNNEYFHKALEAYHGEYVAVGYDMDQARYVWVRELDGGDGQPGRLICVADFTGNKQDYFPKTFIQAAEEKRSKGRVARLENKLRDAQAEFNRPYLIDQSAIQPMPFIDITPAPEPSAPRLVVDNGQELAAPHPGNDPQPRKTTISDDVELAAFAIEHPDELTSNQVRVLRDCLGRQSSVELFRLSGIDPEALRNALRAVA